ncbi:hypothetical protein L873DRAFT_511458 [Choiromyces venosus 120613-1]|uniref:Uncharacterized protein n=1 Tax=Choiromyces venosus 120613-1 TaxID=1336337 RepID=A0A3N4J0N7_9PEZI|nr:hypothetical protein L873DRAFT_511458 [Choiromyces venosus 120613-1]
MNSQTPPSFAAGAGHKGVVRILGCEEVNPDKSDNDDRTPPSFAAHHGQEGVVRILLWSEAVNQTNQVITAQYHSHMPLGLGMREWWKYYLGYFLRNTSHSANHLF